MKVLVTIVQGVRPHGDNLTIVSVDGNEVVANKKEDGSPRWQTGEPCVYVPEGAIIPNDVLQERLYWNKEKNKGLLGGSKGNRVKMQRFAGHESRGLLFKVGWPGQNWDTVNEEKPYWLNRNDDVIDVAIGDDVADFFGITEYIAEAQNV